MQRAALPPIRTLDLDIRVGEPLEIAPGILLLRLPLPFALNHINVYLLDEGDHWTLVDCGLESKASREIWEAALASPKLKGRPIGRILITHHHPDHIGLAGWLSRRFDAPLLMTAGEFEVAGRYADPNRDVISERMGFWREHGLPHALSTWLMERMPRYSRHVHALPEDVAFVDPDQPLMLGGRCWKPLIGLGHSPEHLSLFCAEDDLLLGGDQVLPDITPNIGVWPGGDQDPLHSYLCSLEQFAHLPGDPLLLPAHRQPLRGVQARVAELGVHHDARLLQAVQHCQGAMSCFELLEPMFGRPLRNEEVGFGLGEGVAHLNFLANQGQLRAEPGSDGVRRYARTAGRH